MTNTGIKRQAVEAIRRLRAEHALLKICKPGFGRRAAPAQNRRRFKSRGAVMDGSCRLPARSRPAPAYLYRIERPTPARHRDAKTDIKAITVMADGASSQSCAAALAPILKPFRGFGSVGRVRMTNLSYKRGKRAGLQAVYRSGATGPEAGGRRGGASHAWAAASSFPDIGFVRQGSCA